MISKEQRKVNTAGLHPRPQGRGFTPCLDKGQQLFIGDDIIVTIVDVDNGQVRFGIEAPRDIIVDRLEVRERRLQGWAKLQR